MMYVSKFQLAIIAVLFLLLSCAKNESPTAPANVTDGNIVLPVSYVSNLHFNENYNHNRYGPEYTLRFRAEYIDYEWFSVASVFPADFTSGVDCGSQIKIVFSEAFDPVTLNESSIMFDPYVDGTFSFSRNVAIFAPSADLILDTLYTVTILNSVADKSGNCLLDNYSWQFSTESIVIEPPENLRGYYIGRYIVTENVSTDQPSRRVSDVEWTFTDYSHYCNTVIDPGGHYKLCDFRGDYAVDNDIVFISSIASTIEICDFEFLPAGYFTIDWILLNDGNDTLVIQQQDWQNDIIILAILEKQEARYIGNSDIPIRSVITNTRQTE